MKIGIDMGHPFNCGAFGIMSETDGNRAIGKALIQKLQSLGHTVINCTYDINESELANRVRLANAQYLDFFISIHMDSYDDSSANGVTIYTTETSSAKPIAEKIINEVANSCGYYNRSWKAANFYVLRNTNAPAILIECGFVTNQNDCNKFNSDKIASAIVQGLIGEVSSLTTNTALDIEPSLNNWVSRLQQECNNQGFSNQVVDGIVGNNTLSGCPMLKKGSQGNITKLLQEKLNALGYDTNGIDGIFGQGTYNAVYNFQCSHGLGADGIVGQNTWRVLLGM